MQYTLLIFSTTGLKYYYRPFINDAEMKAFENSDTINILGEVYDIETRKFLPENRVYVCTVSERIQTKNRFVF